MGAASSQLYLPSPGYGNRPTFCMISFPASFKRDEVCLLYGNSNLLSSLREAIQRSWPRGIELERPETDTFGAFKLHGKPFGRNACKTASFGISQADLMCALIENMMRCGWQLKSAINFCRTTKSDTFLFEEVQQQQQLLPKVSAIRLQASDQLFLIGLPHRLDDIVKQIINTHWPTGVKSCKRYHDRDTCMFVFKRYPWTTHYILDNLGRSRMVLLEIVRAVLAEGYLLYGSGHPQQTIVEVDTLFFIKAGEATRQTDQTFLFGPQKHDYMIAVDAPEHCVDLIRECINTAWPQGLNKGEVIGNMSAFKLNGYPWHASGSSAVSARFLMIRIFEKLRSVGWKVLETVDMNKNLADTSCFIMQRCEPEFRPIMAIKLTGTHEVRLINAPYDAVQAVLQTLTNLFPGGCRTNPEPDSVSIKFGDSIKDVQGLFCFVIDRLKSLGWELFSSADLSVKYHADRNSRYPLDLHTMFFEKLQDTLPNSTSSTVAMN